MTTPSGTGTSSTPFTVLPQFVNVGTGDLGVLDYAYALEQLEAAFYAWVKAAPPADFFVAERENFTQIAAHEAIHRDFFKVVINRDAPGKIIPDLTPVFDTIDFTKRASVLNAARTFEDLGVAAHNGAAKFLSNAAYLVIMGKIVSVEARHSTYVRDLITPDSFASADVVDDVYGLDSAKSPAEVAALVNVFLVAGSKLDVSGLA
ncbi:ferritin-like domain-containing protein [Hymenobacter elongatus]|uniref:ferritin-like domain-containing protein n=1 Tax=Hymenobacter elongatus TaxID=877208 RepID=UPI001FD9E999|nr:ferritin-like domain-containing protein [Hymenobacter elongatus]